jgi:phosphohistidine phosphatase
MKLMLMRHGEASYAQGATDHDRPLTQYGIDQARAAGQWLNEHDLNPELILCSSARRTQETYELVGQHLKGKPRLAIEDELYLAEATTLLDSVQSHSVNALLVIAHNPGLSSLATALKGEQLGMGTAYIAVFEVHQASSALTDLFVP